jgi:hypothetical protein
MLEKIDNCVYVLDAAIMLCSPRLLSPIECDFVMSQASTNIMSENNGNSSNYVLAGNPMDYPLLQLRYLSLVS